jgi:hypothetical protein
VSDKYQLQRVRIVQPEFSLWGMHLVADPEPPKHEIVKIKHGILSIRLTFTELNSWVVRHSSSLEDRTLRLGGSKRQKFYVPALGLTSHPPGGDPHERP